MKMGTESKKIKRNRPNIKASIIMAIICVLVMSTATYAWVLITNTPKVSNLTLTADTLGTLQIAEDTGSAAGTYGDILNLQSSSSTKTYLNPVTTSNGVDFYSPNYNYTNKTVESVTKITDKTTLHKTYIYYKTFYVKAGDSTTSTGKKYDICLVGTPDNKTNGTYINQKSGVTSNVAGDTAGNAIRVSFTLEDGTTVIYEPNSDEKNKDTTRAINGVGNTYGAYTTLKQKKDGSFVVAGTGNHSKALFTIDEGKDVKVTMRIWIEGTDDDCTNSIAADQVVGQIQFISAEKTN